LIARVSLALLSAVLIALLAVSIDALRADTQARKVAFGPDSGVRPEAVAAALADAREARRLAPDAPARLTEAFVLARAGRRAAAARVLERVVRDEPENVDAWVFLSNAAGDRRRARAARRRAQQLNPRLGRD
jgi:predicted Zn-dependent protease